MKLSNVVGNTHQPAKKAAKPLFCSTYSPERKYRQPYYINTIEIVLLWAKITYLKSHAKVLAFNFQTDMKLIFYMRY